MSFWRKLRRLLGFPGFDYQVYTSYQFAEFDTLTLGMIVREDVVDWLDRKMGRKNWRVDFDAYEDGPAYEMKFEFRHQRDAMLFKLSW